MPRIERAAEVTWEGSVARGTGTISGRSGALRELPFSLASRVGDPDGRTSPEELIASAVGGCFAMSLSTELTKAQTPPERLAVTATCTVDEVDGNHRVTAVDLEVRGRVLGIDEEAFRRAAEAAEQGCTMAALVRASGRVSLAAHLEHS